jgi:hypothetical protein
MFGLRVFIIHSRLTHKDPVNIFDVEANEDVCFKLTTNSGPSDNPMQSEITGHIGGQGNHFCRKCDVGGTKLHKESDGGFHSLFEVTAIQVSNGMLIHKWYSLGFHDQQLAH